MEAKIKKLKELFDKKFPMNDECFPPFSSVSPHSFIQFSISKSNNYIDDHKNEIIDEKQNNNSKINENEEIIEFENVFENEKKIEDNKDERKENNEKSDENKEIETNSESSLIIIPNIHHFRQ